MMTGALLAGRTTMTRTGSRKRPRQRQSRNGGQPRQQLRPAGGCRGLQSLGQHGAEQACATDCAVAALALLRAMLSGHTNTVPSSLAVRC